MSDVEPAEVDHHEDAAAAHEDAADAHTAAAEEHEEAADAAADAESGDVPAAVIDAGGTTAENASGEALDLAETAVHAMREVATAHAMREAVSEVADAQVQVAHETTERATSEADAAADVAESLTEAAAAPSDDVATEVLPPQEHDEVEPAGEDKPRSSRRRGMGFGRARR